MRLGYIGPLNKRIAKFSGKKTPKGCIEWQGQRTHKGYGILKVWKENVLIRDLAHRVKWKLKYGYIPGSICVLHKCDNPSCINLRHLFLGTKGDNNSDRHNKGRSRNQHTGKLIKSIS